MSQSFFNRVLKSNAFTSPKNLLILVSFVVLVVLLIFGLGPTVISTLLSPATPTEPPTATSTPPTDVFTPTPAMTASPTPTPTATDFALPLVPTESIEPTVDATPEPSETPASDSPTLHLFAQPDSLTLYVPPGQPLSLDTLQFAVNIDSELRSVSLEESFDVLMLTNGTVQPETCLVFELSGENPPLSASCTGQVYRRVVGRADAFWYDFVSNRQLDVAVLRDSVSILVCSAAEPDCAIPWP